MILRGRKKTARKISPKSLLVALLVVVAIVLVTPFTYGERAYLALDDATRHWSGWGNQLLGIDVTSPRQNIFSLARDLHRVIVIVDHGTVYRSRLLGLVNFVSRGSLSTISDALRWYNVPLTRKQASEIQLCKKLDLLHENEKIVVQPDPIQKGIASWYGPGFHGRLAASGEIYNMYDRTAAHRTLPLQSLVRVVSQRTGQTVVVRINDRGPYAWGRIIDMSHRAKQLLGMDDLAAVYLELIDPTALDAPCN